MKIISNEYAITIVLHGSDSVQNIEIDTWDSKRFLINMEDWYEDIEDGTHPTETQATDSNVHELSAARERHQSSPHVDPSRNNTGDEDDEGEDGGEYRRIGTTCTHIPQHDSFDYSCTDIWSPVT